MMDEQVRWMVRLLESSLQRSGLSDREVEERLGWEPGALGRMLDGSAADCGPQQLLALLAELGSEGAPSPPQRRERGTQMVQELIGRFHGLGYGQPPGIAPVVAAAPPAADEIEKTVEDVLQRTFGDLGKKGTRGGI